MSTRRGGGGHGGGGGRRRGGGGNTSNRNNNNERQQQQQTVRDQSVQEESKSNLDAAGANASAGGGHHDETEAVEVNRPREFLRGIIPRFRRGDPTLTTLHFPPYVDHEEEEAAAAVAAAAPQQTDDADGGGRKVKSENNKDEDDDDNKSTKSIDYDDLYYDALEDLEAFWRALKSYDFRLRSHIRSVKIPSVILGAILHLEENSNWRTYERLLIRLVATLPKLEELEIHDPAREVDENFLYLFDDIMFEIHDSNVCIPNLQVLVINIPTILGYDGSNGDNNDEDVNDLVISRLVGIIEQAVNLRKLSLPFIQNDSSYGLNSFVSQLLVVPQHHHPHFHRMRRRQQQQPDHQHGSSPPNHRHHYHPQHYRRPRIALPNVETVHLGRYGDTFEGPAIDTDCLRGLLLSSDIDLRPNFVELRIDNFGFNNEHMIALGQGLAGTWSEEESAAAATATSVPPPPDDAATTEAASSSSPTRAANTNGDTSSRSGFQTIADDIPPPNTLRKLTLTRCNTVTPEGLETLYAKYLSKKCYTLHEFNMDFAKPISNISHIGPDLFLQHLNAVAAAMNAAAIGNDNENPQANLNDEDDEEEEESLTEEEEKRRDEVLYKIKTVCSLNKSGRYQLVHDANATPRQWMRLLEIATCERDDLDAIYHLVLLKPNFVNLPSAAGAAAAADAKDAE